MSEITARKTAVDLAERLVQNVEQVVVGKDQEIRLVLAALVADSHVLLEDVPGTAKTMLARSIAASIADATFGRIQCTPDLQPTDVTGLSVFDPRSREFEFLPGPVFAHILLVDEINRSMPKTQSALLEAMAERQVTIDGITHELPKPFLVIATENPIEQEGTFPLPEAQLDRFSVRTALGHPTFEQEVEVVEAQRHGHPIERLGTALTIGELLELQRTVEDVYVDRLLLEWMVKLVRATREVDGVLAGSSVRGSLALERIARAWALLHGRDYVVPSDVEHLFLPVLGHRFVLTMSFLAETRGFGSGALDAVRERVFAVVPSPAPEWDDDSERWRSAP